jgi:hypothetical protein
VSAVNGRDKFLRIARFQGAGELFMPSRWQAYWPETLQRWRAEGLPADAHAKEFFGLDRTECLLDTNVCEPVLPLFEEVVLAEEERTRVIIDIDGVKKRVLKHNRESSLDQWLEYPVRDRESWLRYKRRLDPHSPARYPSGWRQAERRWGGRSYPLGIYTGSLFGWLRHWMGLEGFSYMLVDDPPLLEEILEHVEQFIVELTKPLLQLVSFDFAFFWEDMAWKGGPLVSPEFVKRHMAPRYRRITDLLRTHGVDVVILDSDGNVHELLPLWLASGINGILPNEVAAGMDIVAMRKRYGRDLILLGGIDKRALAKTKREVEEAVARKALPLLSEGGYFPLVDHDVPPDVPLENYLHFLDLLRGRAA